MSTVNEQASSGGLQLIPAKASPPEILALEPHRYEDAVSGPDPQISSVTYVHFTKPNGDEFISTLASAPYYEAKGFSRGAEEKIDNMTAYLDEKAGRPHMEERKQTPEEVLNRIAGVPKSEEEIAAEQEALEKERAANVAARSQPAPTAPPEHAQGEPPPHTGREPGKPPEAEEKRKRGSEAESGG